MMDNLETIKKVIIENGLDYSLYTLARFIDETTSESNSFDLWLVTLVNIEISRGNICLDVNTLKQKCDDLGWYTELSQQEIINLLQISPVVGNGNDNRPLVYDLGKLYLNRFFDNEKSIAEILLKMKQLSNNPSGEVITVIDKLFEQDKAIDYQKLAAITTYMHQISIISGGPGTGKTWTVSKILALLIWQNNDIKIKLAAPTGKAAARLSESIVKLEQRLLLDETIKQRMPCEAVTLHRLLAIHRFTHQPRFNLSNKLDCDVLVVDEASMIDQQMMALLCKALPDHCKLILLGDKDQLSSVEAGSVFADLCGGLSQTQFNPEQRQFCLQHWGYQLAVNTRSYELVDHVVVLEKSHRFDDQSALGRLAFNINLGDSNQALNLLKQINGRHDLSWKQLSDDDINTHLKQQATEKALSIQSADNIQKAFRVFHQYQVLCAVWAGATGVDSINQQLENNVKNQSSIAMEVEFYRGKPLMMVSNAYQFGIHNGDIGIVWPDLNEDLKVWFELGDGEYRALSLSQCPQHKTAYAMTVHKSQGSEFNKVLLILPTRHVEVSTRELFYTGVTRASDEVEIWALEDVVKKTIQQKTRRISGLLDRLSS
jgi:exodeoxyribonuclease V alpha subunit